MVDFGGLTEHAQTKIEHKIIQTNRKTIRFILKPRFLEYIYIITIYAANLNPFKVG